MEFYKSATTVFLESTSLLKYQVSPTKAYSAVAARVAGAVTALTRTTL